MYGKLSSNGINFAPQSDESRLTKLERYRAFVKRKAEISRSFGLDVADDDLHPKLKLHQKTTVKWNVRGGRRADFLAFGLGKTPPPTLRTSATRTTPSTSGNRWIFSFPSFCVCFNLAGSPVST